jgi:hypothetical protein
MTKRQIYSLRLVEGESDERGFTLSSACRRALFRVGCALECNWQVFAPGVADHHFMLMWNGLVLTIVDVGAGDLWVDGKSFHLSTSIISARIQFGSAAMVVDRSFQDLSPQSRPLQDRSLASMTQPIAHESANDDATNPR